MGRVTGSIPSLADDFSELLVGELIIVHEPDVVDENVKLVRGSVAGASPLHPIFREASIFNCV